MASRKPSQEEIVASIEARARATQDRIVRALHDKGIVAPVGVTGVTAAVLGANRNGDDFNRAVLKRDDGFKSEYTSVPNRPYFDPVAVEAARRRSMRFEPSTVRTPADPTGRLPTPATRPGLADKTVEHIDEMKKLLVDNPQPKASPMNQTLPRGALPLIDDKSKWTPDDVLWRYLYLSCEAARLKSATGTATPAILKELTQLNAHAVLQFKFSPDFILAFQARRRFGAAPSPAELVQVATDAYAAGGNKDSLGYYQNLYAEAYRLMDGGMSVDAAVNKLIEKEASPPVATPDTPKPKTAFVIDNITYDAEKLNAELMNLPDAQRETVSKEFIAAFRSLVEHTKKQSMVSRGAAPATALNLADGKTINVAPAITAALDKMSSASATLASRMVDIEAVNKKLDASAKQLESVTDVLASLALVPKNELTSLAAAEGALKFEKAHVEEASVMAAERGYRNGVQLVNDALEAHGLVYDIDSNTVQHINNQESTPMTTSPSAKITQRAKRVARTLQADARENSPLLLGRQVAKLARTLVVELAVAQLGVERERAAAFLATQHGLAAVKIVTGLIITMTPMAKYSEGVDADGNAAYVPENMLASVAEAMRSEGELDMVDAGVDLITKPLLANGAELLGMLRNLAETPVKGALGDGSEHATMTETLQATPAVTPAPATKA